MKDKCFGVPSMGGFLVNSGEVLSSHTWSSTAGRHTSPRLLPIRVFITTCPRVRIENVRKLGHPSNVCSTVHGGHPSLRTLLLKAAAISRPFGPPTSKIIQRATKQSTNTSEIKTGAEDEQSAEGGVFISDEEKVKEEGRSHEDN